MEDNRKIQSPWIKGMLAGFGALSLTVVLFLILYKWGAVSDGLKSVFGVLRPFAIGGALAYIVCPVTNKLEDGLKAKLPEKFKKSSGGLAIAVSMIIAVLVIYLLIIMIIPQMYQSILSLTNTLPDKLESWINTIKLKLSDNEVVLSYFTTAYESIEKSLTNWLSEKLLPDMANVISGVGSGVVSVVNVFKDIIVGVAAAVYLLGSRKIFKKQSKMIVYSLSGKKIGDMIVNETNYANRMFTSFLSGKILDSLIIGILCYIFCAVTKMPNSLLVSVIIGITNIIPFFGPIIGAVPTTLLILIDSPKKALIFLIFVVILQQVDGNIIGPTILGDSTGLSNFWILFSIILFGGWFGFIGMIIGVPLFAVIYDIIRKLVDRGLEKHRIDESLI